jgi:arylsulfatase A-like enzyme
MKRYFAAAIVGLFIAFILILGRTGTLSSFSRDASLRRDDLNVLLISIDTLRPDHLQCYGYDRATSPAVDVLARDGVLFATAIAQAPSTLPSHASILTGLVPSHHGAFHHARARLPDHITTLAEILKEAGFTTAAFHGGGQMAETFGLSQGFDRYQLVDRERFSRVVDHGIQWLEETALDRFFLFLHTYETHVPYQAREYLKHFENEYQGRLPDLMRVAVFDEVNFGGRELSPADFDHVLNAYDAAIRVMDSSVERIIDYLKARGAYDKTLIVFTSDHGEEFGEHGKVAYHCHTVYDELIKVPLIVKLPHSAQAKTRIQSQVRSIDIVPTVLDVLGLEAPRQFDGISLVPLITGKGSPGVQDESLGLPLFAVSERDDAAGSLHVMSIRTNDKKLYVIKKHDDIVRRMLFDLEHDPTEQNNMFSKQLTEQQILSDSLWRQFERIKNQRECPQLQTVTVDRETKRKLEELGYLEKKG